MLSKSDGSDISYTDGMAKNPKKVEAGRKGAEARWGVPRTVRLDELTPAQRRLVLALIEAAKESNAAKVR